MVKKSVGVFKEGLHQADQFMMVVNWLLPTPRGVYYYPLAINLSFACELYLKSIQVFYSEKDEFLRTHELQDLFDGLPDKAKSEIEEGYIKVLENKAAMNLETFLRRHNKAFYDWRYTFTKGSEGQTLYLDEFIAFVDALNKHARTCSKCFDAE